MYLWAAIRTGLSLGAILMLSQATGAVKATWPQVREFEISFGVKLDYRRIDVDIPIYEETGLIRYRLICRGGDDRYLNEIVRRNGVSGYGNDLGCILNVGTRESDASLLSEDESNSVFSRGFFHQRELLGSCASYPEYGAKRRFRLRGFELAISLDDMVVDPAFDGTVDLKRWAEEGETRPVKYAIMTVALRRDPNARTAKSEQPGYLDPKGDQQACKVIKRGNEPRMCRNRDSLSWELCPAGWQYMKYPWEDEMP
jgi:hypothetical protein